MKKKSKERVMVSYTAKGLIWYAIAQPIIEEAIKLKKDVPDDMMEKTMQQAEQITKSLLESLTIRKQGIIAVDNELQLIKIK